MKAITSFLEYHDQERICRVHESFSNGLTLDFYVQINSEKFVEYQKEIFEECLANFLDQLSDTALSAREIELLAERHLKQLNDQLQAFAEKLHDMPAFDIRGYLQLMIDESVKIWMIGNASLMIFRDGALYSTLENTYDEQGIIDLFTDYIGGEVQRDDVYLYAGMRLSDVLDQQDVVEMEALLNESNAENLLNAMSEVIGSRIDKEQI